MQEISTQHDAGGCACRGGRFSWTGLAVMGCFAPPAGLAFAHIGGTIRHYYDFPILVAILAGIFIGLTMVAIARFFQLGHRPTIFSAIVAAALTAAVAPPGKTARPPRFDPLFALLATAAAVTVAIPAVCVPYCDRCGSWFRTVRGEKIDAATFRRLSDLLGLKCPEGVRSPRYRLSACRDECGPTLCELTWEGSGLGGSLVRAWLDAEQRRQVETIVDESDSE